MPFKHNVKLLLQLDSTGSCTLAEAFVKGTISETDLKMLNEVTTFPTNLPEYTSEECIRDFVSTILPYMTDNNLFVITNRLFQLEFSDPIKAFANNNLAKIFIAEEVKHFEKEDNLNHFIQHLKFILLPYHPEDTQKNLKKFIETVLLLSPPEIFYQNLNNIDYINLTMLGSGNQPKDFIKLLETLLVLRSDMGGKECLAKFPIVAFQEEISIDEQNIRKLNIKIASKHALLLSLKDNNKQPDPVILRELNELTTLKAKFSIEATRKKDNLLKLFCDDYITYYDVKFNHQPLNEKRRNILNNMINTCKKSSLENELNINEYYSKFNTGENPKENVPQLIHAKNNLIQFIRVQHILDEILLDKEIYPDMFEILDKNKDLFDKSTWAECVHQFAYNLASDKTPSFSFYDRNDNSTPKLN